MAETNAIYKEFKTKIALKYNTYEYWKEGEGKDYAPLKGEVCLCEIPDGNAEATTAPTVLFKVGVDGVKKFSELKWVSALAADVYSWAKKTEEEFKTWVKDLVPVEVIDEQEGKFVTGVSVTNDENGHHITIARADVQWDDVQNKPEFEKIYKQLQTATTQEGNTKKTITKVEQNANGEVTVTYSDIDYSHADAAGKTDEALTVKVGGVDVVFDGSEAKTADVDAAIAAAIKEEGHPEYSIVKDAESEYAATYHLTKDGVNVGAAINIPKDLVVESGKVETLEAGEWGDAGTYIVLTLANATNDKIYVNVGYLIEYVTSGSTADDQVIIAIDDAHKVTATIGAGKIGTIELTDKGVTEAKLSDDVATKLNKVWDEDGAADAALAAAKEDASKKAAVVLAEAQKYADEHDADTTYTAAADGGLKLTGTEFAIDDSIVWVLDCNY